MGANLCSLRPPDNHANGPRLHQKTSFVDLLIPDCLKTEKRKQQHQEENKVTKVAQVTTRVKRVTLEEWILASPAVRRDVSGSVTASEVLVPKQSSHRVCPYLSSTCTTPSPSVKIPGDFSLARDSLSLERRTKVEETSREGMETSRSQSGKLKKRVSFRLPEEADIIFFYSPEDGTRDWKNISTTRPDPRFVEIGRYCFIKSTSIALFKWKKYISRKKFYTVRRMWIGWHSISLFLPNRRTGLIYYGLRLPYLSLLEWLGCSVVLNLHDCCWIGMWSISSKLCHMGFSPSIEIKRWYCLILILIMRFCFGSVWGLYDSGPELLLHVRPCSTSYFL